MILIFFIINIIRLLKKDINYNYFKKDKNSNFNDKKNKIIGSINFNLKIILFLII
jgi:hypothetical protein